MSCTEFLARQELERTEIFMCNLTYIEGCHMNETLFLVLHLTNNLQKGQYIFALCRELY